METLTQLLDYLQGISESFSAEKSASKIFSHKGDAGTTREDILKKFLENHLPARCEVIKGGFLFDSEGNQSKQIDLIVANDITLQFRQFEKDQNGKAVHSIDGCYAAVSIKTMLDKEQLFESLSNLESIPDMPELHINPLLKKPEILQIMPYRVIFAYDAISSDKILEHLVNFYTNNKIPNKRKAQLIVVNDKFIILNTGPESMQTLDGKQVEKYAFHKVQRPNYNGALGLLYLLTNIQYISQFGSQFIINFREYSNQILKQAKKLEKK